MRAPRRLTLDGLEIASRTYVVGGRPGGRPPELLHFAFRSRRYAARPEAGAAR
jgi:hypothetical protein